MVIQIRSHYSWSSASGDYGKDAQQLVVKSADSNADPGNIFDNRHRSGG